jgi:hypothetical protein
MKDRELLAAMAMQALIKVQRLRRLLLSQWLAEAHRPGPGASHEPLLRARITTGSARRPLIRIDPPSPK